MSQRDDTAEGTSDYELIGGGPAVTAVVHEFYEAVLADPQLAGFFEGVDLARLKRHQVAMVSQVLGGPVEYDGRELGEVHAGLSIGPADFAAVVDHLVAALQGAGVPDEVIGRVGVALGATEPAIVSSGAP
jgi:hemoglobin